MATVAQRRRDSEESNMALDRLHLINPPARFEIRGSQLGGQGIFARSAILRGTLSSRKERSSRLPTLGETCRATILQRSGTRLDSIEVFKRSVAQLIQQPHRHVLRRIVLRWTQRERASSYRHLGSIIPAYLMLTLRGTQTWVMEMKILRAS